MSIRRPTLPTLLSLTSLLLPATVCAQIRYTVSQLTTFEAYKPFRNWTLQTPVRISNAGQIAAWTQVGGEDHAYAWQNGTSYDLGGLAGALWTYAHDINSSGVIVGASGGVNGGASMTPFIYENGVMSALPQIANQIDGMAYGINDSGLAVGYAQRGGQESTVALTWNRGQINILLDAPNYYSAAMAVNNAGQIILSSVPNPTLHETGWIAYLEQNGSLKTLPSLGGWMTLPVAINDLGQVVGYSTLPGVNSSHAVLWQKGVATDLNPEDTGANSNAYGINNSGQIVGAVSYTKPDTWQAVLWQNGVMSNLNDLIPQDPSITLVEGDSINDQGAILAKVEQTSPVFERHLCLLTPTEVSKADIDGSGKPGIVWQNSTTGDVGRWIMNGTAIQSSVPIASAVPAEWRLVGTPELNGDTQADLLWQNSRTGAVAYWLMDKGKPVKSGVLSDSVPLEWQVIATPDLDGDGCPDLLWRNTRTGDVAYWLLKGTAVQKGGTLMAGVPLEWNLVGDADLDSDHQADLLWQNQKTGAVGYWLLKGLTVSQSSLLSGSVPLEWQVVGTSDLSKSGETDVLWRNSKTGDVTYWHLHQQTVQATGWLAKNIPLQWKTVGMR